MADAELDRAALERFLGSDEVLDMLYGVADEILDDAQRNVKQLGAYRTGELYRSRHIERGDDGTILAGFTAEYAHVVHDGLGRGKNDPSRPFLTDAAYRRRGHL